MSNKSKRLRKQKKARIEQDKANQERYIISYYKRNPIKFLENELGVKLSWYQRMLIKLAFKGGFKNE